MPFLPQEEFQGAPKFVGEDNFVLPDNEKEEVMMKIYLACPKLHDEKIDADFAEHGPEFIAELKKKVLVDDVLALQNAVDSNNGSLTLTLNEKEITLKHKEHFFLSARERAAL